MAIVQFAHPLRRLTRSRGLLRLAVAATVLTLGGVAGAVGPAHAEGPAAAGSAAGTATTMPAPSAMAPNADRIDLAIDPPGGAWVTRTYCTARAYVSYSGDGSPRPGNEVTVEALSGPAINLPQRVKAGPDGYAVVFVPRPTQVGASTVIRATIYDRTTTPPMAWVVSNTATCQSLTTAATATALACLAIPNPC